MWTSIIIGFLGGLAIDALNLMELQNIEPSKRPNFKDVFFWLPYIAWPLLGGLLTYLYEASDLEGTETLGRVLAQHLPAGTTIALCGTLGAGKTRLVQALVAPLLLFPSYLFVPVPI